MLRGDRGHGWLSPTGGDDARDGIEGGMWGHLTRDRSTWYFLPSSSRDSLWSSCQAHITRVTPAEVAWSVVSAVIPPPGPLLTKLTSFFSSSSSFSFCFLLPPPFSEVVAAGEYSRPACGRRTPWARWHHWCSWHRQRHGPHRGHGYYHGHGCHRQHGGHRGHRHHRGYGASPWAWGGLQVPVAAWAWGALQMGGEVSQVGRGAMGGDGSKGGGGTMAMKVALWLGGGVVTVVTRATPGPWGWHCGRGGGSVPGAVGVPHCGHGGVPRAFGGVTVAKGVPTSWGEEHATNTKGVTEMQGCHCRQGTGSPARSPCEGGDTGAPDPPAAGSRGSPRAGRARWHVRGSSACRAGGWQEQAGAGRGRGGVAGAPAWGRGGQGGRCGHGKQPRCQEQRPGTEGSCYRGDGDTGGTHTHPTGHPQVGGAPLPGLPPPPPDTGDPSPPCGDTFALHVWRGGSPLEGAPQGFGGGGQEGGTGWGGGCPQHFPRDRLPGGTAVGGAPMGGTPTEGGIPCPTSSGVPHLWAGAQGPGGPSVGVGPGHARRDGGARRDRGCRARCQPWLRAPPRPLPRHRGPWR